MKNKLTAIILGGIQPHGILIQKLKARGYYTILIDYFDNPPASLFADLHLHESAMDFNAVLRAAQNYHADLVISSCLDQQMVIAVQVAEALQLPHPFSEETVLNVTNKKRMKRIMLDHHIPTAKYIEVDKDSKLTNLNMDYPLIVKPVDNCGAAGVRKIYNSSDLSDAVKNACHWSRTNDAIIEEYKEGNEFSAYMFIKHGKAQLIVTQNRYSVMTDNLVKCYGAKCPASLTDQQLLKVEKIGTQIASAFHLDNVPLFFQAIANNDEINIIEFSPRLGGGVCYKWMELNASYDMLEASIDSWLGIQNNREPVYKNDLYLLYQIQGLPGTLDRVDGVQEMLNQGYIKEVFFHKTKGAHIDNDKGSSSRVAAIIIDGSTLEECSHKLQHIMNYVKVLDFNGKDITDRSDVIYDNISVALH